MRYSVRTPYGTFHTRDRRAAGAIVRAIGGVILRGREVTA